MTSELLRVWMSLSLNVLYTPKSQSCNIKSQNVFGFEKNGIYHSPVPIFEHNLQVFTRLLDANPAALYLACWLGIE